MKKIILSLLVATIAIIADAQVHFAPEIGWNYSNFDIYSDGNQSATNYKEGIVAGGFIQSGFTNRLFLQSGLYFRQNGCVMANGESIKYNSIQFQANINGKYEQDYESAFMSYAGFSPYVAYNYSGTIKHDGSSSLLKFGSGKMDSSGNIDKIKAFDYGLGANFGIIHSSGFFVRIWLQCSLNNIDKWFATNYIRPYSGGASIGYIIGYSKGHKDEKIRAPYRNRYRN